MLLLGFAGRTQTAPQAPRVRRPIPTNLSFSPAGSLGLQNAGSAFDLPSLLQLTSAPSRDLPSFSEAFHFIVVLDGQSIPLNDSAVAMQGMALLY